MAVIVSKSGGVHERIAAGKTIHVTENGSLIVRDPVGHHIAAYCSGHWFDAILEGEASVAGVDEPPTTTGLSSG